MRPTCADNLLQLEILAAEVLRRVTNLLLLAGQLSSRARCVVVTIPLRYEMLFVLPLFIKGCSLFSAFRFLGIRVTAMKDRVAMKSSMEETLCVGAHGGRSGSEIRNAWSVFHWAICVWRLGVHCWVSRCKKVG